MRINRSIRVCATNSSSNKLSNRPYQQMFDEKKDK